MTDPPHPRLRTIDLFAGCGGLTQGFATVGDGSVFEPVQAVELDPAAAATYRANHGDHVYVGDINDWLTGDLPDADVVLGGPPCQGYSALGSRNPADPRNQLWNAYVETVQRVQPLFFVLENVPLFLDSAQFDLLQSQTRPGGRLDGYHLETFVLNSADYGAAQTRRRALVIGRLDSIGPIGSPEPTTPARDVTVGSAFRYVRRNVTRIELPDRQERCGTQTLPGPFLTKELHLTRHFEPRSIERFTWITPGGNRFDIPEHLLSPCWKKHRTGSGDVMGRLRLDKPSVTIRTEFFKPEKGRYLHPTENRSITHFEAARIQGFPDDYRWFGTKVSIARQIGNAVPIPLAKAIGTHLAAQVRHSAPNV